MTTAISPVGNGQFFDGDGDPLAGGYIFGYINGSSSILQQIYDGETPRANPIQLNSSGFVTGSLFLDNALTYTIVVTKADGTTVLQQWDGVTT